MEFENTLAFARKMDEADSLKKYRTQFLFPDFLDKPIIYFTGNSLGLQPKQTKKYIQEELDVWAKYGVEGHFKAKRPWFSYHEFLSAKSAKIVGALEKEVVITHSLSTNLHLLLVSFYQPKGKRTKILCEAKAFPSDQYILQTQVQFHNLDSKENIIEMEPREGEHILREEDIIAKIHEIGDELALVMFGGVNYYNGQLLNMKEITIHAHQVGAIAGFDLAHAAGNVALHLHDWKVDFAAWCTYKYLNSSPGGVSGIFVHERHLEDKNLKRFGGWWGHDKTVRFKMEHDFQPMHSAESWQLSNAPILGMAAHLASLNMFDEVGMDAIGKKRDVMTAYLEFVVNCVSDFYGDKCNFEIITPKEKNRRGSQLSILVHGQARKLFDYLTEEGVIADWREPNVIRVAPVPMYNSFEDVYRFGQILAKAL